jgi:hypothetical protein
MVAFSKFTGNILLVFLTACNYFPAKVIQSVTLNKPLDVSVPFPKLCKYTSILEHAVYI